MGGVGVSTYLSLIGRRRGGRLFEAGCLLTFSACRMGAYSRWALIRGWALIRINTVSSWACINVNTRKESFLVACPTSLLLYNVCYNVFLNFDVFQFGLYRLIVSFWGQKFINEISAPVRISVQIREFTAMLYLFAPVSTHVLIRLFEWTQPRPRGFSLKKWVGPTHFLREKPWGRGWNERFEKVVEITLL